MLKLAAYGAVVSLIVTTIYWLFLSDSDTPIGHADIATLSRWTIEGDNAIGQDQVNFYQYQSDAWADAVSLTLRISGFDKSVEVVRTISENKTRAKELLGLTQRIRSMSELPKGIKISPIIAEPFAESSSGPNGIPPAPNDDDTANDSNSKTEQAEPPNPQQQRAMIDQLVAEAKRKVALVQSVAEGLDYGQPRALVFNEIARHHLAMRDEQGAQVSLAGAIETMRLEKGWCRWTQAKSRALGVALLTWIGSVLAALLVNPTQYFGHRAIAQLLGNEGLARSLNVTIERPKPSRIILPDGEMGQASAK